MGTAKFKRIGRTISVPIMPAPIECDFKFPASQKKEIFQLIKKAYPSANPDRVLAFLELLVDSFQNLNQYLPKKAPSAPRRELTQLLKIVQKCQHTLAEGKFSRIAWRRLARELATSPIRDYLAADDISTFPPWKTARDFQRTFNLIFEALSAAIQTAATPTEIEKSGGRPKIERKRIFVFLTVCHYENANEKWPPIRRESAFEHLLRHALEAVPMKPVGNLHELIREARAAAKASVFSVTDIDDYVFESLPADLYDALLA